jgi:hypothetical protein
MRTGGKLQFPQAREGFGGFSDKQKEKNLS